MRAELLSQIYKQQQKNLKNLNPKNGSKNPIKILHSVLHYKMYHQK